MGLEAATKALLDAGELSYMLVAAFYELVYNSSQE